MDSGRGKSDHTRVMDERSEEESTRLPKTNLGSRQSAFVVMNDGCGGRDRRESDLDLSCCYCDRSLCRRPQVKHTG